MVRSQKQKRFVLYEKEGEYLSWLEREWHVRKQIDEITVEVLSNLEHLFWSRTLPIPFSNSFLLYLTFFFLLENLISLNLLFWVREVGWSGPRTKIRNWQMFSVWSLKTICLCTHPFYQYTNSMICLTCFALFLTFFILCVYPGANGYTRNFSTL